MTTALVIGGSGMVGTAVRRHFDGIPNLKVLVANRTGGAGTVRLDALDPPPLDPLLEGVDIVVNAVGVLRTHPDYPGDRYRSAAVRVNALFPLAVAEAAARQNCRVVHVSSDAVFPPSESPVDEGMLTGPWEPYGQTKALGESDGHNVLNIRCSVIGPAPGRSTGLWEWFVGQPEGATVPGYSGQLWTGVTSKQLAVLCSDLIDVEAFNRVRAEGSCHHFAPNGSITKLDLLRLLQRRLRPDIKVVPATPNQPGSPPLTSRSGVLMTVFTGRRGWPAALDEIEGP